MAGGYRAIDSLRLEKGYRVWGADITPDDTPARGRAGLLRAATDGGFLGAEALRDAGAARGGCAASSLEDPRSVALGNEPVRVDGEVVGRVTSGGYGYTVERSIAYAYLPPGVDVGTRGGGRRVRRPGCPATVRPSRSYDPEGARIRA